MAVGKKEQASRMRMLKNEDFLFHDLLCRLDLTEDELYDLLAQAIGIRPSKRDILHKLTWEQPGTLRFLNWDGMELACWAGGARG